MITAKDIHKKKFEKVKFGYSPEEVDEFLSQIENDMQIMQQDLDDANAKVQLLADKVREYKDTEEDLKNALLGAQKQAREVVAEARAKAAQIEADAQQELDNAKSQAVADSEANLKRIEARIAAEHQNLEDTQHQISAFKQKLFELYKQHLEMISRLPENMDDLSDIVIPQPEPEQPEAQEEQPAPEQTEQPESPETAPSEPETDSAEPELPEPDPDDTTAGKGADEEALAETEDVVEEFTSFGSRRDETKKKQAFD